MSVEKRHFLESLRIWGDLWDFGVPVGDLEFRLWEFKKSSHLLDFSPREFVRENS
jgi:hypothetical protein